VVYNLSNLDNGRRPLLIKIKAEASHKTPTEIIGELVREKIAVSM